MLPDSNYLRLIVLTAGTLLPFFWIVVLLGHRRQRNFERIFFFLCLAMVFFFGASLLALNAQLHYGAIPPSLTIFSWTVLCLGLWFLPPLLIHLHVEYAQIRGLLRAGTRKRLWLIAAYTPVVLLLPWLYSALRVRAGFDFVLPGNSLGRAFQAWLVCSLLIGTAWQWRFTGTAPDKEQQSFHNVLRGTLFFVAVGLLILHFLLPRFGVVSNQSAFVFTTILGWFALAPLIGLLRNVQQFNFLQIGRQRNLVYAVFVTFLGLLYLSFVRRISLWMEPYLPPEASAALLLFLPVVFFEPLQRLMGRILRRTAHREMDRTQRMMGPIGEVARLGDFERLTDFIEKWVRDQLQLAEVNLELHGNADTTPGHQAADEVFVIRQAGHPDGALRVRAHGAMLSGETVAALEFLCEQLPGALDLCRLIEEKLQLERELAERERLAALGQMAASISHNLKNPLGSMKTILQLQLENPEMPGTARAEIKMVLNEIERLSVKLNQLLRFSRPTIRGGAAEAKCDARAVVEEVVGVLRHEAARRGVDLGSRISEGNSSVEASSEALNDVVSNLVVNALEASSQGGQVSVEVSWRGNKGCVISVEDDGAGIPERLQEKVVQPFFTTKSQGTGLGLAIVARRVSEFGGKLEWTSPASGGKGTRFEVTLQPARATPQRNEGRE